MKSESCVSAGAPPEIGEDEPTFCEKYAVKSWGKYLAEVEKRVILRAHEILGKPGVLLEVGCEGGRWSKMLMDSGWEVICTDVNKKYLDVCQRRLPQAKCILTLPEDTSLPVASNSVDSVLCVEVFPVMDSDWFLPEASRVLRGSGRMIGVCLNQHSLRGLFAHYVTEPRKCKTRFRHYQRSYSQWRRNLARSGFRVVYQEGFCWAPFSRMSDSSLVPVTTFLEKVLGLGKLPQVSPWIIFVAEKIKPPGGESPVVWKA